jgi:hypothetical protein
MFSGALMRERNNFGRLEKASNQIIEHEDHAEILVKRWSGEICRSKISKRDIELVKKYSWQIHICGELKYLRDSSGRSPRLLLHNLLIPTKEEFVVDHKNRDGLDNRRENLRLCTRAENCRNSKPKKLQTSNGSRYKGVTFHPKKKLYQARICFNRQRIRLGRSKDEKLCAFLYDVAALELHGEFACINYDLFPGEIPANPRELFGEVR